MSFLSGLGKLAKGAVKVFTAPGQLPGYLLGKAQQSITGHHPMGLGELGEHIIDGDNVGDTLKDHVLGTAEATAVGAPLAGGISAGGLAMAGLGTAQLAEHSSANKSAAQAEADRQELLRRNLMLAEQEYAKKEPYRQGGMQALSAYFAGGGRGMFNAPVVAGDTSGTNLQPSPWKNVNLGQFAGITANPGTTQPPAASPAPTSMFTPAAQGPAQSPGLANIARFRQRTFAPGQV